MVNNRLPGTTNPARNVLTGYLGSCYSQPEKGPRLYLHCTSTSHLVRNREKFKHELTHSARRPTPVRILIRTIPPIPNALANLDALQRTQQGPRPIPHSRLR